MLLPAAPLLTPASAPAPLEAPALTPAVIQVYNLVLRTEVRFEKVNH